MTFLQYDMAMGRFHSIDKLAYYDYGATPYHFGLNNPIYFSDPSGLTVTTQEMIDLAYWVLGGGGGESNDALYDAFNSTYGGGGGTEVVGATGAWGVFGFDGEFLAQGNNHLLDNITVTANRNGEITSTSKFIAQLQADIYSAKWYYPDVTYKFNNQIAQTKAFFSKAKEKFNSPSIGFNNLPIKLQTREALKLGFFVEAVKTGSVFDIKSTSFSFEALQSRVGLYNGEEFRPDDFGNYNFGVAAKAFGYSEGFATFGAGFYQVFLQDGQDWNNWSGTFDFQRDTNMIRRGFQH